MGTLNIFGFRALWSPYFLVFLLMLLTMYFLITVIYRRNFKNSETLTTKQGIIFSLGILLLYVIKGAPVDLLGHLMFSAHMTQMAILYLIIPPLLIIGIPQWIWRNLINVAGIKPIFMLLTKPLIGLILFNGFFSIYHIPMVFDMVKTDKIIHASYTFVLFLLAINMWWPLINQLEEHQTLNGLKKVGYIFAEGVLLTPACALIIFADTSLFATYSNPAAWQEALKLCVPSNRLSGLELTGPEIFNSMSLVQDQQLGGVLMKIIQEVVLGIVLASTFFEWYRKDQEASDFKINKMETNRSLNSEHREF